jgi:hypothetical protein
LPRRFYLAPRFLTRERVTEDECRDEAALKSAVRASTLYQSGDSAGLGAPVAIRTCCNGESDRAWT